MNYLAHLYLSGETDDLLVGNFIGDSVRGDQFDKLAPTVQAGVRLHRAIDRFTDTHETVRCSKQRMWHVFGRYSSVVADVFLDHFLARDWDDYHHLSLDAYSRSVESILRSSLDQFPERSRRFFDYMTTHRVLVSYATVTGTGEVLTQMARRARFQSSMEFGGAELRRCYEAYGKDFRRFFPELCRFAETRRSELSVGEGRLA